MKDLATVIPFITDGGEWEESLKSFLNKPETPKEGVSHWIQAN